MANSSSCDLQIINHMLTMVVSWIDPKLLINMLTTTSTGIPKNKIHKILQKIRLEIQTHQPILRSQMQTPWRVWGMAAQCNITTVYLLNFIKSDKKQNTVF